MTISAAASIVRIAAPAKARHGDAFEALRISGAMLGREADPYLAVDHFRMKGPTFPPHAHAGFSAVTYVLPESPGSMRNRDGRGDRSLIGPGGLHWTAAGSGLVHEEVPEPDGTLVEGLQIFVRQPVDQETCPAVIDHVEPEAVPVAEIAPGGWVRVLAGSLGELRAPFETPSPLQLLDIALAPGGGFEWHNPFPGGGLALYLFSGAIDIEGEQIAAPGLVVFDRGCPSLRLFATIGDARLVLFAGEPVDAPAFSNGPFVLSSETALADAVARYRRGEMGTIPASS